MRVEYDDDSARCHYCGEKLTNKEYLKRHLQNKRCKEKVSIFYLLYRKDRERNGEREKENERERRGGRDRHRQSNRQNRETNIRMKKAREKTNRQKSTDTT